ncbi:hypothetical protein [Owenweeksia hongkongensis]|uniref:hypothetical protein n=1 Tax=Owenweeksia hongkongensis TaxID=253245 RepID=UPI003A8C9439
MNIQQKSIWGKWWIPIRKWFYTLWLAYETTMRFYEYALSTEHYFDALGYPTLAIISSVISFVICAAFLTFPACFILYKFFDTSNLTGTSLEARLKPYL